MCLDQEKTQGIDPGRVRAAMDAKSRFNREREQGDREQCDSPQRPTSQEEIVAELFRYHPPTPEDLPKYNAINQAAKNFAEVVLANCPGGADRVEAIRAIQYARMVANRAIACRGLAFYH